MGTNASARVAPDDLEPLTSAVQKNCHISDAQYAQNYTLCTYLLKMREYYRWEKGYPMGTQLPRDELGEWLTRRERLWADLESESFVCVPVNSSCYDPFDAQDINREIIPLGLVYSAGYGQHMKPHFFLGRLERAEKRRGFRVLVSSLEYARDLGAPAAMSQSETVFVRKDVLRRLLWEKVEEWRWKKRDNPMGRAIACYEFDVAPERALERMTDRETEAVILHELGECLAGERLGGEWEGLLAAAAGSTAELMARAVRDHLADCLSTLPALLEREDRASLHFYFANLTGMRKHLFPAAVRAYGEGAARNEFSALAHVVEKGRTHWLDVARQTLALYRRDPGRCAAPIEAMLESARL